LNGSRTNFALKKSQLHAPLEWTTGIVDGNHNNEHCFTSHRISTNRFCTAALFAIVPVFEITNATYTVSVVPDAIRGRILSLTRLVMLGANSLGVFITGILLHFVGSTRTIVIFSCLLLVLALMVILYKPLRQI
jgi:hypothetical protein